MRQTPVLAPSILSADFSDLGKDVSAAVAAGADWIHFDVMDNHYVPNITFGPCVLKALRDYGISVPIDVHLMVKNVDSFIEMFATAGATTISFHPDSTKDVIKTIELIKRHGCNVGLVFNPNVDLDILNQMQSKLDLILLMSVNPGFAGQSFISSVLDKAKTARKIIDQWGTNTRLQIDGGVTKDNIAQIAASGVDTFVAGSAVFNHRQEDYPKVVSQLKELIK